MPADAPDTSFALRFSRYPSLALALAYMVGLIAAAQTQISSSLVLLGIALAVLFPLGLPIRRITLLAAFAIIAWGNHWLHTAVLSGHDLRILIGNDPQLVTVQGRIASQPQTRAQIRQAETHFHSRVTLRVDSLSRHDQWQKASGKIEITVPDALSPHIFRGQHLRVHGALQRPALPQVPGQFNYRRYLQLRGIHYEMNLNAWPEPDPTLGGPTSPPLTHRLQAAARRALALGQPPPDDAHRLIWAMVTGWRTWLTGERKQPFLESGTLHLFAISGLHIALIAGILVHLSRIAGIPRRYAGLLIIPALWLYTASTGNPASAVRAATMSSVVLLGWLLQRPPELLNSLGVACLLILLVDPLQLQQTGFQLSFAVVTTMILMQAPLATLRDRLFADQALRPPESTSRLRHVCERASLKLFAAAGLSLSAWLGSAPLIAASFHLITPVSLIANLILVPLASLVMASAALSFTTAWFLPSIASLANSSAWLWMRMMITCCEQFAALPGAWFTVPDPGTGLVLTYYLGLLLCLTRPRYWLLGLVATGILGLSPILKNRIFQEPPTHLWILPIPQGDAIFLDAPGNDNDWRIDGGPEWCAGHLVAPFLAQHQPGSHNHILTHGDKQHLGSLPEQFQTQPPKRVVISAARFRSRFYRDLVNALGPTTTTTEPHQAGDHFGPWKVVLPEPATPAATADEGVLVLLGEWQGIRVLLLSDLARANQRKLLEQTEPIHPDIVCLNLPDNSEPPNTYVLRQLQPRVIIVSGSNNGRGTRWVRAIQSTVHSATTKVLFTGTHGTVRIDFGTEGTNLQSQSGHQITLLPNGHHPPVGRAYPRAVGQKQGTHKPSAQRNPRKKPPADPLAAARKG